jgi:molybdopterin-containing oxidoreductase family iron-sulfur binding subunit
MKHGPKKGGRNPDRREFLKCAGRMGIAGAAVSLLPSCAGRILAGRHYKELSPEELEKKLERLEQRYKNASGKEFIVGAEPPLEGVLFGYALDLSRCVGCRRCVYACVEENNLSRDPQMHWIRVLSMEKERGVDLSHSDPYYDPSLVPEEGRFYMPVACQQCENPPCVKVCPVQATWQEPDGITVIDYDWCIGCRYCMAACPYGARHFNWAEPQVHPDELNTDTHYLGNRPRSRGVVEKCTFCIHRTRRGLYPACVEVCPVGARKFGNLLDPDSEVRYAMKNKRVLVLKEEVNTMPRFFYFYGT